MEIALIVFLASFATAWRGRGYVLVAQLAAAHGRSVALLVSAAGTAAATSLAMAVTGGWLASHLAATEVAMLAMAALLFAAIDLAWPVRGAAPKEPTRSLGAIALVLAARQLFDAPRLIVFAAAAASASPVPALWGGALGSSLALAIGWLERGGGARRFPAHFPRRVLASCMIVAAICAAL